MPYMIEEVFSYISSFNLNFTTNLISRNINLNQYLDLDDG